MTPHIIGTFIFGPCPVVETMRLREFSIHDWVGPASRTLPTTDLYFLNACRSWLDRPPFHGAPIRRIGANTFTCRDAAIVSRRDKNSVVNKLLRMSGKRLFYIVDDNLWAAENDDTLPEDYRQKLIAFRDGQHRILCERAETIIVSSDPIAENYRRNGHTVVQLDPYWSDPLAGNSHFEELEQGAALEVGYLGSGTHAADRAFVIQVFEKLLESGLNTRMTMFGRGDIPDHLARHFRFRSLKNLRWPRYRKRLANLRFHILLYPMLPSGFNDARSINKVIEHAVAGGIGLYSASWPCAAEIDRNKAGFLLENDVNKWSETILDYERLVGTQRWESTAQYVRERNEQNRAAQLRFWCSTLNL